MKQVMATSHAIVATASTCNLTEINAIRHLLLSLTSPLKNDPKIVNVHGDGVREYDNHHHANVQGVKSFHFDLPNSKCHFEKFEVKSSDIFNSEKKPAGVRPFPAFPIVPWYD